MSEPIDGDEGTQAFGALKIGVVESRHLGDSEVSASARSQCAQTVTRMAGWKAADGWWKSRLPEATAAVKVG